MRMSRKAKTHWPSSNSGCSIPFGKKQPLSLLHLCSDATTAPLSPKVNFYPPPNIPLPPVPLCRCAAVPDKKSLRHTGFPARKDRSGAIFLPTLPAHPAQKRSYAAQKSLSGWGRVKVYNALNRLMGPWEERNVLPLAKNKPVI